MPLNGSRSTQAGAEERQYKTARGNIKALKQYVADCKVCAFAQDRGCFTGVADANAGSFRSGTIYYFGSNSLSGGPAVDCRRHDNND
jgi:hypothetical protein